MTFTQFLYPVVLNELRLLWAKHKTGIGTLIDRKLAAGECEKLLYINHIRAYIKEATCSNKSLPQWISDISIVTRPNMTYKEECVPLVVSALRLNCVNAAGLWELFTGTVAAERFCFYRTKWELAAVGRWRKELKVDRKSVPRLQIQGGNLRELHPFDERICLL